MINSSKTLLSILTTLALSTMGLVACEGGEATDEKEILDETGTHTQFVINGLQIPQSATETKNLGFNLDNDENGKSDNALGGLLATLITTANLDLQTGIDTQIADGSLVLLTSIKATDLTDASGVGVYVYFGDNPMPTPCTDAMDPATCGKHLTGSGTFDVSAASPLDSILLGNIQKGELSTEPGKLSIELPLGDGAPLVIDLVGARIEGTVTAAGITNARLGGAITMEDVNSKLIPGVQKLVESLIMDDCTPVDMDCGCEEGSSGAAVLDFFDGNKDCMIPLEELSSNRFIDATLNNPDVDLFDAEGSYNPSSDGIKDSLSLAIGFSAVSGTFPLPAGVE